MNNRDSKFIKFQSGSIKDVVNKTVRRIAEITINIITNVKKMVISFINYEADKVLIKADEVNMIFRIMEDKVNMTYIEEGNGTLYTSIPVSNNTEGFESFVEFFLNPKGMTNKVKYILSSKEYISFRFTPDCV